MLERSLLLKGQVVNIVALHLLARSLLALAAEIRLRDPDTSKDCTQRAARIARKIKSEQTTWGDPLSQLILASVRAYDGTVEEAVQLLYSAERGFLAAEMNQYRAASQWCRGHLMLGPEGVDSVRRAEDWMAHEGVKAPKQMLRLLAPGNWEGLLAEY